MDGGVDVHETLSKAYLPHLGKPPQSSYGRGWALGRLLGLWSALVGMGAEESRTQQFLFLSTGLQLRQGRHSPFPNFLSKFRLESRGNVFILFFSNRQQKQGVSCKWLWGFMDFLGVVCPRKGRLDHVGCWSGCKELACWKQCWSIKRGLSSAVCPRQFHSESKSTETEVLGSQPWELVWVSFQEIPTQACQLYCGDFQEKPF